jgi:hypothetical protein
MINNTTEREILESLMDPESRRVTPEFAALQQKQIKELRKDNQAYPDAKKHQIVSFIKSGIRILGYILIPFNLYWAAGILIISELIGIYEELV